MAQTEEKTELQVVATSPAAGALQLGSEIRQILAGTTAEKDAMIISAMYSSGFFKDLTSLSRAITKVLIGAQMGMNAVQAINGLVVVDGKVSLDSHTVRQKCIDAGYGIEVLVSNATECKLQWHRGEKILGTSEFTWDDAKRTGLADKANWKKWPSDMLFARATTQGARRYAADAFGGTPVYDRDEVVEGELVSAEDANESRKNTMAAAAAKHEELTKDKKFTPRPVQS